MTKSSKAIKHQDIRPNIDLESNNHLVSDVPNTNNGQLPDHKRLELLYRLSQHISQSLEIYDVAQRALDEICKALDAHHGIILVHDEQDNVLHLMASVGIAEHVAITLNQNLRYHKGLSGWVAQHRESALVEDVAQDSRWFKHPGQDDDVCSAISVPLTSGEALIGVLTLSSTKLAFFTQEHLQLLESAAVAIGISISNAWLYGKAQQRARDQEQIFQAERRQRELTERLQKAALLVNSSLETQEVLELILDQLGHVFPYESGSIQILEDDSMRILAVRNQPDEIVGRRFELATHLYNRQLAQGKHIIVPNVNDPQYGWVTHNNEESTLQSSLGVPLWIRERVIGALTIDSSTVRNYTEEDVQIVRAFAQQAAIAIENARLFDEQRTQRELAEALAEAAAVVGSTLDLEKVLDRILEQAARVVKGDIFNILMISGNKGEFVRWLGYNRFGMSDADIANIKIPVFEYPKLVQMMETGEPVLVEDIFKDPGWVQSNPYRKHMRSYVAAPIRIANKTEGFLNVNGTRPNQFNVEDAQRLLSFADHASVAIQNANLFQQQRNYSEQLEKQVRLRTIQLEARNAWLQAILDSTTDGIIVTDSAGDIVQRNQVVEKWLTKTLPLNDVKKFYDIVREIARQHKERGEILLELTEMDLELNAAPISDQDTKGPATVIAVHDVTYLKELDRMKSRFVSNVSHELRTPLTSIRLYATLIRKSNEEGLEKYIDALDQEAERLSDLVEDILQISRIESGKFVLKLEPTDLNVLTETVVAGHIVLAESHNLNMTYHASTNQTTVKIDRDKFTQVLNNIIENAINYTSEGGHIQVSTGQQTIEDQHWATVMVQDTGMGIPEDEIEYIFERFFRGGEPQKRQIQGSGLGLAIVKEIIHLHGGKVNVESKVGVGSTFIVQIPLVNIG